MIDEIFFLGFGGRFRLLLGLLELTDLFMAFGTVPGNPLAFVLRDRLLGILDGHWLLALEAVRLDG